MEISTVEKLEEIHCRFTKGGGNVISILQDIQSEFRYIPEDTVLWFSRRTGIPASKFHGVITFYSQFHTRPRGQNVVTVCCGTVCHVKGAERILSRLRSELKLKGDQDTTRDGKFTLEKVSCVGACSIAPVIVVNSQVYGNMGPGTVIKEINKCRDGGGE